MKRKFLSSKLAFSLIEILVAVIITGVVLISLTPVITSKAKNKTIGISKNTKLTCEYKDNDLDKKCCRTRKGKGCVTCDWKCVSKLNGCSEDGHYVHPHSCRCSECGIANCKKCVYKSDICRAYCTKCKEGYRFDSEHECVSICDNTDKWYALAQTKNSTEVGNEAFVKFNKLDNKGMVTETTSKSMIETWNKNNTAEKLIYCSETYGIAIKDVYNNDSLEYSLNPNSAAKIIPQYTVTESTCFKAVSGCYIAPQVVDNPPQVIDIAPQVVDNPPQAVDIAPQVVDNPPQVIDIVPLFGGGGGGGSDDSWWYTPDGMAARDNGAGAGLHFDY